MGKPTSEVASTRAARSKTQRPTSRATTTHPATSTRAIPAGSTSSLS